MALSIVEVLGRHKTIDPEADRVREEALRSAEPTHTHPDGAAGPVAVASAAALAVSGVDRTKLLDEVVRFTPSGHTLNGLRRALELGLDADPAGPARR